jgi:hypothetical protein
MRDLPEYRITIQLTVEDSQGNDITEERIMLTDYANKQMAFELLIDCWHQMSQEYTKLTGAYYFGQHKRP